jgi:uncharacterized protein YdcH (DUF465 family)
MFEGQQPEIETLMQANPEFRQLFHRHRQLDKKVMDAELGVLPVDANTLRLMKREKLQAKQKLTRMFEHHRTH